MNLAEFWEARTHEPVKRNHDGVRYHGHRFPIKGGISRREAMCRNLADNITKENLLLAQLTRQSPN